jgi:hypothetical protein
MEIDTKTARIALVAFPAFLLIAVLVLTTSSNTRFCIETAQKVGTNPADCRPQQ